MPDPEADALAEIDRVCWSLKALAVLVGSTTLRDIPAGLEPLLDGLADRLEAVMDQLAGVHPA